MTTFSEWRELCLSVNIDADDKDVIGMRSEEILRVERLGFYRVENTKMLSIK